MDEDIERKIRLLRMSGLLANWDEYLRLAREGSWSHARLLEHVVETEYEIKKENSRKLRMKKAKMPERFVFETYPFDRQPKLSKKKLANIYDSFDYMEKKRNIVWIGPTGTGKTGLATSFLVAGDRKGLQGQVRHVPRPRRAAVPVRGRPQRGEARQKLRVLRLPSDRRAGLHRGGADTGRPLLLAHAKEARKENDADHLEPGLQPVVILSEKRPFDRRPDRPSDGKQPRGEHEKLRQPSGQARADVTRTADELRGVALDEVWKNSGVRATAATLPNGERRADPFRRPAPKFMNWKLGVGGGGAIDLAMHLMDCDFKTALRWLDANFAAVPFLEKQRLNSKAFRPPPRCDAGLPIIKEYLCSRRRIPLQAVNALLKSGRLYADSRNNAVFPMLGKNAEVVGAELRGTGAAKWRGMAPGSRKSPRRFHRQLAQKKENGPL